MTTIAEYVASLEPGPRSAFERVLDVALQVLGDADDGVSYGIPVLTVDGQAVLGLLAGKKHLSLYPFSGTVVEAMGEALRGFSVSTGTIRFTVEHPLPDDVVREVVERRLAQVRGPAAS